MVIGIVGLGLIGGSFAKALKSNTNHKVLGYDISQKAILESKLYNAIDGEIDENTVTECDIIFVALYPQATSDFIKMFADKFKKSCIIVDCGGIKRKICEECFKIAKDSGFTFIGGHPMAGRQYSGFKYAKDNLYKNAIMIITPPSDVKLEQLASVQKVLKEVGFSNIQITTPEEHDRIIAFTSQLAHVVSNAYVKSPNAAVHKGFSAGSYNDLTRVARLNENMWTELFLENSDNLIFEIDTLIANLKEYSDALKEKDSDKLKALLKDGSDRKKQIDR